MLQSKGMILSGAATRRKSFRATCMLLCPLGVRRTAAPSAQASCTRAIVQWSPRLGSSLGAGGLQQNGVPIVRLHSSDIISVQHDRIEQRTLHYLDSQETTTSVHNNNKSKDTQHLNNPGLTKYSE
jgi:hypothetical protein